MILISLWLDILRILSFIYYLEQFSNHYSFCVSFQWLFLFVMEEKNLVFISFELLMTCLFSFFQEEVIYIFFQLSFFFSFIATKSFLSFDITFVTFYRGRGKKQYTQKKLFICITMSLGLFNLFNRIMNVFRQNMVSSVK